MDGMTDTHRARIAPLTGVLTQTQGEAMAVLVLRGNLLWSAPGHAAVLPAGSVVVDDGIAVQRCAGASPDRTEVLCLWPADDVASLPMVHEPGSRLARAMQALAETLARGGTRRAQGDALQPVVDTWRAVERECDAAIARCHGRTPERRRQVFLRLSRARALLALPEARVDLETCAEVARMSPWHFVRLFHKVFEEAPHRFHCRGRMRRARQLIEQTDLPVRDVMRRVGYSSAPIFARAFRQHFGASATALRSAVAARAEGAPPVQG